LAAGVFAIQSKTEFYRRDAEWAEKRREAGKVIDGKIIAAEPEQRGI